MCVLPIKYVCVFVICASCVHAFVAVKHMCVHACVLPFECVCARLAFLHATACVCACACAYTCACVCRGLNKRMLSLCVCMCARLSDVVYLRPGMPTASNTPWLNRVPWFEHGLNIVKAPLKHGSSISMAQAQLKQPKHGSSMAQASMAQTLVEHQTWLKHKHGSGTNVAQTWLKYGSSTAQTWLKHDSSMVQACPMQWWNCTALLPCLACTGYVRCTYANVAWRYPSALITHGSPLRWQP